MSEEGKSWFSNRFHRPGRKRTTQRENTLHRGSSVMLPNEPSKHLDDKWFIVTRVSSTGKHRQCTIQFLEELLMLHFEEDNKKHGEDIDVTQIREIRLGRHTSMRNVFTDEEKDLGFVYLVGDAFVLEQYAFIAQSEEHQQRFTEQLRPFTGIARFINPLAVSRPPKLFTGYGMSLVHLARSWDAIDKEMVNVNDIKCWLGKLGLKAPFKDVKEVFQSPAINPKKARELDRQAFELIHKEFMRRSDALKIFPKSNMTKHEIIAFFQSFDPSFSAQDAEYIFSHYGDQSSPFIDSLSLLDYLHSPENSIVTPHFHKHIPEYDRPLSDYFLSTSHNTYLTGSQLYSKSSVEAYIKILRSGSRCVELDCFDGKKEGEIAIYHKLTFTSTINFRDVIEAINEHAFETSHLPLILSLENHCSPPFQRAMAKIMKEVFGAKLITSHLHNSPRDKYPSPNDLKKRIIVKNKKHAQEDSEDHGDAPIRTGRYPTAIGADDAQPSTVIMTEGMLRIVPDDEVDDKGQSSQMDPVLRTMSWNATCSEENYNSWYHGRISESESVGRLKAFHDHSNGVFLVRDSSTRGCFTIQFFSDREIQKLQVQNCEDGYMTAFTGDSVFGSLGDAIDHFRSQPISADVMDSDVRLTVGVPAPPPHEKEGWYHPNLSREEANGILLLLEKEGHFLVRHSETTDELVLSFSTKKAVCHYRLSQDGPTFSFLDIDFPNLVEMVSFFKDHPIHQGVCLQRPVLPDEVASLRRKLYEQQAQGDGQVSQFEYIGSDGKGLGKYRAVWSYAGQRAKGEISFPKGAIIEQVKFSDGEWSEGSYGGRHGRFPSILVEPLELDLSCSELNFTDVKLPEAIGTVVTITENGGSQVHINFGDDMEEWKVILTKHIMETKHSSLKRQREVASTKHSKAIDPSLSDMVYYCRPEKFREFKTLLASKYYTMTSISENKLEAMLKDDEHSKELRKFTSKHMVRIYPAGNRFNSSNLDPTNFWNHGCQMVALNFQTGDVPAWLNSALFLRSNGLGMVPRPTHDAKEENFLYIDFRVISGRHLSAVGTSSPSVRAGIKGDTHSNDYCIQTETIPRNGLNPSWNMEWNQLVVQDPVLSFILFEVYDQNNFGDADVIAHAAYPLDCNKKHSLLRPGYRSIPLLSPQGYPFHDASLLVEIKFEWRPRA